MKQYKKEKSLFWKIYIGVVAVALIATLVVVIVLYNFLKAYEASQPEHCVENAVELLKSNSDEVYDYLPEEVKTSLTMDEVKPMISAVLEGKELSFKRKFVQGNKEAAVFTIKHDKEKIAEISLKKSDEKGSFDTTIWEIDRIDGLFKKIDAVSISAPEGYKIMADGKELGAENVVETKETKIGDLNANATVPKTITYQIKDIYKVPEIKCLGSITGQEIVNSGSGYNYIYGFETNDNLLSEHKDRIDAIAENYVKYVTNDVRFSAISGYVLNDTKIYKSLSWVAESNVWYAKHSGVEFSEKTYSDFKVYNQDCFSCNVKFKYYVIRSEKSEFPTDLTMYFVKRGNGWYIADMIIK